MHKLDLERQYTITTIDTTYHAKLLYSTDSSLIIEQWVRGQDSSIRKVWIDGRDSLAVFWSLVKDTTALPLSKTMLIETSWIKSSSWLEPFLWMGLGAVMGVALLPVAAIDDGASGVRDWAIFEGALAGSCGIAIFVASRKIKYDLKKEWVIEVN